MGLPGSWTRRHGLKPAISPRRGTPFLSGRLSAAAHPGRTVSSLVAQVCCSTRPSRSAFIPTAQALRQALDQLRAAGGAASVLDMQVEVIRHCGLDVDSGIWLPMKLRERGRCFQRSAEEALGGRSHVLAQRRSCRRRTCQLRARSPRAGCALAEIRAAAFWLDQAPALKVFHWPCSSSGTEIRPGELDTVGYIAAYPDTTQPHGP